MEVQKEEVRVEAVPLRQDYSRDDEAPKPFPFDSLGQGPQGGKQGFHCCSDFCVKTGRGSTGSLPFPSFMLYSRNFYDPGWSLRAIRRLKNAIVLVEWVPDSTPSGLKLSAESMPLNESSKAELKKAFELFDMDQSKGLDYRCRLSRSLAICINADCPI